VAAYGPYHMGHSRCATLGPEMLQHSLPAYHVRPACTCPVLRRPFGVKAPEDGQLNSHPNGPAEAGEPVYGFYGHGEQCQFT
jgi:hypothetical protein